MIRKEEKKLERVVVKALWQSFCEQHEIIPEGNTVEPQYNDHFGSRGVRYSESSVTLF